MATATLLGEWLVSAIPSPAPAAIAGAKAKSWSGSTDSMRLAWVLTMATTGSVAAWAGLRETDTTDAGDR